MMASSLVKLTVDLGALHHNYLTLRRRLDPGTKMLAVVKADAYGHGLLPAARTLAAAGADYLGVASLEEGLTLRREGLDLPILLLVGIVPRRAGRRWPPIWRWSCTGGTWPRPWRRPAGPWARKSGCTSRWTPAWAGWGLLPRKSCPFWRLSGDFRHLEVMGLISHLAVADPADKTYTRKQLQDFLTLLAVGPGPGLGAAPEPSCQQRRPLGVAGRPFRPGAAGD